MTEDLEVNNTSAVISCSTRNRKNKQSSALLRFFGLRNQNDHSKSPLPPFKKGGKIPAFTLAEVLVTLGIIGIIAAMTLPMLAENYQRRVIETRLKKFYTTFNQAILRSIDVNGPYEGWIYWNIGKKDENGNYISAVVDNDRSFSFYLRPYLSIIQTQKVVYTNGEENVLYYFSDGSAFMFHENWNRLIRYYPKDPVRCLKQAAINRCGVCEFRFHFNPLEKGSGWKYLKGKGLEPALFSWDGKVDTLYNHSTYGCSVGDGVYCAALIQYNNWEFPPDYPRKIRY